LPFGTINDSSSAISIDTFVDRAGITVLTVERFKNTPDLRIAMIDRAWIAIDAGIDRYMEATYARVTHVCGACVVVVTIGVRLTFARRNTFAVDANFSLGTVCVRFAARRGHTFPVDTDLSLRTVVVRFASGRGHTFPVDTDLSLRTVFVRFASGRGHTFLVDTDLSLAAIIIVFAHSRFARPTIIAVPKVRVRGIGADGDCVRVVGIAGGNVADGHFAIRPFFAWTIRRRKTGDRHTQTTNAE